MTNNTQTPEGYAPFDLYPYNPSQGPAYASLGLFGAAGIAHFIMMFPYRSAFPIPMIIGCGTPPFLAATIYMSLGRITRAEAPRVGFQHNCILKFILSMSAFHLTWIKPIDEQRYSLIAETHLTAALQPAMILISNLGGDNGPAAYLTCVLICFIALAKGPSPGNLLLTDIKGQVSWLHLLRGVRLVVESTGWSSIFSGTLAQYAPLPSGDTLEHTAATNPNLMTDGIEDWRSSLNRISNLIAQLAEENMDNVYDRELQALTTCFERTFCKGQDAALDTVGRLLDVIGWVYRLGDDYMGGLRQIDLISTVILGHFCVLLRTVEAQYWFMHGWAAHVIGEILVISPNTRQWLSWPIAYLSPEE
ncbi:hypothetical protein CEK26_001876 [Fusarium fujikuroi]|nr:hypothetical protein CEK26_001876 [Fusarium fujikuroi]